MKIGMVLHKPFPPDPRVAREAKSLIEAGHTVFLLCLGKPGQTQRETIEGLHVVRAFLEGQHLPENAKAVRPRQKTFFIGFEPYTVHARRFRLTLGPLRFSFKVPRFQPWFSYTDSRTK